MASVVKDAKVEICLEFILEQHKMFVQQWSAKQTRPMFVGLNGVQGAGKTTLVNTLLQMLNGREHNIKTIAFSIDDLYRPHNELEALARSCPGNPLVQHRGEPSTHDIELGASLFDSLLTGADNVKIPAYDKSLHSGKGDRVPQELWQVVNKPSQDRISMVLFEGWCVGFRALSDNGPSPSILRSKYNEALQSQASKSSMQGDARAKGRLCSQAFENVAYINNALTEYDVLTDKLDAFIAIDARETGYVYDWRLEQEAALRAAKGTGMSDEQVINFVNGYYPAYELYLEGLRQGVFQGKTNTRGKQLNLTIGKDRGLRSSRIL